MQILLRGQTCQLCVIITHLVVDCFDQVVRCDRSDDFIVVIEHRDGILRIVFQLFDLI